MNETSEGVEFATRVAAESGNDWNKVATADLLRMIDDNGLRCISMTQILMQMCTGGPTEATEFVRRAARLARGVRERHAREFAAAVDGGGIPKPRAVAAHIAQMLEQQRVFVAIVERREGGASVN